jgi:hypothetical protein
MFVAGRPPDWHDANVTEPSAESISAAIVAWTGYGQFAWPQRDESRVVAKFGNNAVGLMPHVMALDEDFYSSTANHTVSDLNAMAQQAASEFRERHPEVSSEAIAALAWCYSFDFK